MSNYNFLKAKKLNITLMQLIPEVTFLSEHKSLIKETQSPSCSLSLNQIGAEAFPATHSHPSQPSKHADVEAHWGNGKELNFYLKFSFDKLRGSRGRKGPGASDRKQAAGFNI